jgi:hypothetical protein
MCGVDNRTLVDEFWTFHTLAKSKERSERLRADEHRWAYETVTEAMEKGGPDAIALLVALADAAPDPDEMGYLGAGPIEDLLHEHRSTDVDLLDELARKDARIRRALRTAILPDMLSSEQKARLTRYKSQP